MIKHPAEKNLAAEKSSKCFESSPVAAGEALQSYLTEDSSTLKYKNPTPEGVEEASALHWGQRKLLISEIEFLNTYGTGDQTVLYIGAAPGFHIPYLASLFPGYQFILYDATDFAISPNSQLTLHQEYFTTETAQLYAEHYQSKDLLFISDIRSASYDKTTHAEAEYAVFEKHIKDDLLLQQACHQLLKPAKSLLKFRLPFTPLLPFEYLSGKIYLQAWATHASTETRLVPDGDKTKMYDPDKYGDQMFYFNQVARRKAYPHDIDTRDAQGLDHSYDSAREIEVLRAYLSKQKKLKGRALHDAIIEMSKTISREISSPNEPHTLSSRATHYRKELKRRAEKMRAKAQVASQCLSA